jgi:amidase
VERDFNGLAAKALVTGLQSGRWTSVELTQHFLDRIEKEDPKVHAIPFVFRSEALLQAKESDGRRAAGSPLSCLDGLPMTIKDAIRIKDRPTTYGMWPLRNYRPKSDSELIKVLRSSGIVFLGRSAVPTAAFDWNCRNLVYPECVNPFDPQRTPGGSSGGAAAALAKGFTPPELGSDLGGSIRYPAHCCGVYGLKTTDGWLPNGDAGPEASSTAPLQLLSFGPMARYLEDLDLLLERFAAAFICQEPSRSDGAGGPFKIAYSQDLLRMSPEPSTEKLFETFRSRLATKGHSLAESQPALDFDGLYHDWGIIAGHEYSKLIPGTIRNAFTKRAWAWWILNRRLGSGPFTDHFKRGMLSTETDYQQACERRKTIFDVLDGFFRTYDFWILPVAPSSAIPRSMCGRRIKTANGLIEYSRYLGSYIVPTTTLGTPVLTYPIGFDDAKMPVAVQIHGPRYSDRWLVKAAARLEQ